MIMVLEGTDPWTVGEFIDLDYVILQGTAAVPEPATIALLTGFAALGLVMYRRRRRS